MDYIKAFFIGIIESFINVIPTSFSGHEKIYFYTNSYISGDNHDTLIPFIVKIACLIAIIYYFRKMYKDILLKNMVLLFNDVKGKKFNIKEVIGDKKITLIILIASAALVIIPLFGLIFKNMTKNMLVLSIAFMISGIMMLFAEKIREKENETISSGISIGILKSFSVFPGFCGICGIIFASLMNGIKKSKILFVAYCVTSVYLLFGIAGGIIKGFVIHYNVFYYLIVFVAALPIAYFGIKLTEIAFNNKKIKYFGIYNIVISIMIFLIWVRG